MKRRSNLLLYLLLNILVSAATTLAVLAAWDNARKADLPSAPPVGAAAATATSPVKVVAVITAPDSTPGILPKPSDTPQPIDTLPPVGQAVIQIQNVVGVGDIEQEVVTLKRVGSGNVRMAGWKLEGEHNNSFVFPDQPELILYQDGAVQLFSKAGTDTATEVYWNRKEAAWRSGETIKLLDPQGNQRAVYSVP